MVASSTHGFETGPLSVEGIEKLLAQILPEQRAKLAWMPTAIRGAIDRFLDGPRDESGLRESVLEIIRALAELAPTLRALDGQPELLRSVLEEGWRNDAMVLRGQLDTGAADAADWALRTWTAFCDLLAALARDEPAALLAAASELDSEHEAASPATRLHVLLMATVEAAGSDRPTEVTSELAFAAFDEARKLIAYLEDRGVHIDPFRGETLAERAIRARRYAAHLRSELGDAELAELESSRLRSLR